MIKLISFFCITLYLAFIPIKGTAQTSSDLSNQPFVDTLIEELGIKYQMEDLTKDIRTQFEQNPFQLPQDTNEKMLNQFSTVYDSNELLRNFKTVFQQQIEGVSISAINKWLNSDAAINVHRINNEFYTLQGSRQRVVTMYEMDQSPPSEQRKSIINTLAEVSGATDQTIEFSVIIFRSLINKLNMLSERQNLTGNQIDGIVDNFRMQIQSQARQQVSNQFLVKYFNISGDVLRSYISFYKSEAGQWLSIAISKSMHSAFETAASKFKASN